jgi:hypothetical protein
MFLIPSEDDFMRPAANSRGAGGNRADTKQRNINNDKKGQAGKVYAGGPDHQTRLRNFG